MVSTRSTTKPCPPRSTSKSRSRSKSSSTPSSTPAHSKSNTACSSSISKSPPRKHNGSKQKKSKFVASTVWKSSINSFPPTPTTSSATSRASYLDLVAESFTTGDNHNHNHGIGAQSLLVKSLFILTNLGYLFAALTFLNPSSPPLPTPILQNLPPLTSLCSNRPLNTLFCLLIFFASSIFHTLQCFKCRSKKEVKNCVWWNEVDLCCAGSYGGFICVCFFKRDLLLFLPCLFLLVSGGIMKLQGYYKVYFLLHGLWHLTGAWWFLKVVCEEGERLI
ncbi:hypothetical protein TrLO_g547 [Triparma laevis f. longispina]|uniref:Transmembrane protein n=1 Tax=Triparma laevis f. longispina TaxID=1714387 RepID=A0A9W7AEC5_9STRA|nr:hypothetical protein TrLO_g547 [Triparma laevis f. longispina]